MVLGRVGEKMPQWFKLPFTYIPMGNFRRAFPETWRVSIILEKMTY